MTTSRSREPLGVLVLEHHNDRVAEMHVLAVSRRMHRQGVGRELVAAAEDDLDRRGVAYMQVKTLGASHPSQEYAATRAFYEALGYQGLEQFAEGTIWPGNPCLIMVKHLAPRTDWHGYSTMGGEAGSVVRSLSDWLRVAHLDVAVQPAGQQRGMGLRPPA